MCTVTIVETGDRLRVVCNRDERRDRAPAYVPFLTRTGKQQVLAPQDPQGRGTWIAANSGGIVFALLNVSEVGPSLRHPVFSRGVVIPSLTGAATLDEVVFRMSAVPVAQWAPFRLLAVDSCRVAEFVPATRHGAPHSCQFHRVHKPLLFTSSSLGDTMVEGPRRTLFEQMLPASSLRPGDAAARQNAFHSHRWRDRPALSVHMSRPDACTVSTTTVEVTERDVRMVYEPAHCDAGTPVGLVMERQHAGHIAAHQPRRRYAAV
jgi:hypothetical protein